MYRYLKTNTAHKKHCRQMTQWHPGYVNSEQECGRRKSRSAHKPISVTPAHRSVPAPGPSAPRSAPLFSATPAHRSAPLQQ